MGWHQAPKPCASANWGGHTGCPRCQDYQGLQVCKCEVVAKQLSPEVVRADAEGMALSIVEDDRLVKGLQDLAAKSCSEEGFRDCLDQGLKCETDRWEGHVIWLGPKAVEYFWGPTAGPPRYLRRVTCASSQSRAATVIDIAEEERAAARGWAKMHAFLLVHLLSLKRSDITKGMLLKLKCNDAPHVNKEGMMESFQAN